MGADQMSREAGFVCAWIEMVCTVGQGTITSSSCKLVEITARSRELTT